MRWSRTLFWVFVSCLAAAVLGVTAATLTRAYVPALDLLFFVLWFAVLYLVPAIVCVRVLESGRALLVPTIGLCATGAGFGLWLIILGWEILRDTDRTDLALAQVPIAGVVIGSCAASILMTMRLQRPWEIWVRRLTLLALGVGVIYTAAATWIYHTWIADMDFYQARELPLTLFRYGGMILLVVCVGVFALGTAHYNRRFRASEVEPVERLPLHLKCPRCGSRQTLRTEGDHCASCGLRITVRAS